MNGWLGLIQLGLSPYKKRQASPGALIPDILPFSGAMKYLSGVLLGITIFLQQYLDLPGCMMGYFERAILYKEVDSGLKVVLAENEMAGRSYALTGGYFQAGCG
jgi:hypothetical protein